MTLPKMNFSNVMSLIGAACVATGGVLAAITTLPVWVGPALAGVAYMAGHLATSPVTTAAIAKIVAEDGAKIVPTITTNETANKIAAAANVTVKQLNKANSDAADRFDTGGSA